MIGPKTGAKTPPPRQIWKGDVPRNRPQPVEIDPASPLLERTSSAPDSEVKHVPVYTFVIYDHDKGTTITYPRMATRRAIANMRGKVNEDSGWMADERDLDVEGFYLGESPQTR